MNSLRVFAISFVSFLALDLLWFRFAVKAFYLSELSEIGRIKNGDFDVLYVPALLAYFFMALAMSLFVAPKISLAEAWWLSFVKGALMGLILYGVFDMTNLAILKNYPMKFLLVDMAWGTFTFGIVTLIARRF